MNEEPGKIGGGVLWTTIGLLTFLSVLAWKVWRQTHGF